MTTPQWVHSTAGSISYREISPAIDRSRNRHGSGWIARIEPTHRGAAHGPATGYDGAVPARVNIDGRILEPGEARVSVFDRGFLYGDSVYEVVRTYGGRPFELDAHLARLAHSAARIG